MTQRQRRALWHVLSTIPLFAGALLATRLWAIPPLWEAAIFAVPYLFIGGGVLLEAGRNLVRGRVFDEELLMAVATLGAFAIEEYPEAVFVMLFFKVGELFEQTAVHRSRRAIAALAEICPDTARLLTNGGEETVDAEDIPVGACIRVLPGERIPLDGVIEEGASTLDTAALTGESLPRDVAVGDTVASGSVNLTGVLRLRVLRPFAESTASRILEMVENATDRKARAEQFITRFSRVYTPTVCALALLAAFLPLAFDVPFTDSLRAALNFLVISCPCALVISVPLTFFCGIGGAARRGILLKGASELETLAAVKTAVFDKTGTLTEGRFSVTCLHTEQGVTEEELLSLALAAESHSLHPIARSVCAFAEQKKTPPPVLDELTEQAGEGIRATIRGERLLVGNARLMRAEGISVPQELPSGSAVLVARGGRLLGYLVLTDRIKSDTAAAITALRRAGITHTVMLSGDRAPTAEQVAQALGLDEYRAELLPADKVAEMERIREKHPRGKLLYVRGGINNAPVIAASDVGVAMGALGSDAAAVAADVVLMDDSLAALPRALTLAKKTRRIVWQNVIFSLGVKVAVMVLSLLLPLGMWAAVFADVGVSVIAILNASRAWRIG